MVRRGRGRRERGGRERGGRESGGREGEEGAMIPGTPLATAHTSCALTCSSWGYTRAL